MRKVLIAAVAALAGMSTMAHAADIYEGSLKDEPVAYTPAPIWAGLYVGGHVGGLWNDSGKSQKFEKDKKQTSCPTNFTQGCTPTCTPTQYCDGPWVPVTGVFDDEDNNLSLLGGVHVGYNWQDGAKVYGVEGDVSFADGLAYLASLRARLGHLVNDDLMIFATAGIAFAGFEDKVIDAGPLTAEFSGDSEVGLVVGGGIERKISSSVSIGVEGLYYFFDDAEFSKEWAAYCKKIEHEDDNDLFVVRARLSYSLQRDEPLDSYK